MVANVSMVMDLHAHCSVRAEGGAGRACKLCQLKREDYMRTLGTQSGLVEQKFTKLAV